MKLGTYAVREIAVKQARRLAETAGEACYVIELQAGWTIYYAGDEEFSNHRPATYIIVEPGS